MQGESHRTLAALGVGAAIGLSVGALLWRHRASAHRVLLLKALEGETIRIPQESRCRASGNVLRAFYGHPNHVWEKKKGKDVTNKVRAILGKGGSLKADNDCFGDSAPGVTKMLVVEIKDDGTSLVGNDDDREEAEPEPKDFKPKDTNKTNRIAQRPIHTVLRPDSDPRIDPCIYVRYDPHPERKTGAIVIVVPGGNYDESCIDGLEGQVTAQWFVELGITAVVLKYRTVSTGHYWPAQLEDYLDCARAVKAGAASWGCDPERIGVIGYSAGSHVASYAASKADRELRPKLQIQVYPAIDTQSPHEDGDMDAWAADQGYPPIEASTHIMVSSDTSPAFLVGVAADRCAPASENTDVYERVLREHGVACENVLNEDEDEEHGCGPKDWWTAPCAEWLRGHGWAMPDDDADGQS